jgi:quercetin dioxygenase-like cupin family protein
MKPIDRFPEFVTRFTEAALPIEGARGWFVTGDGCQVAFIEFADAAEVPEHSHEEQWELVVAGSVRLSVAGQVTEFGPGDNFFIPAGVPHSARVSAGYRAVIVFNEPSRYAAKRSG